MANSFLIETDYNSDIGSEIRQEINEKFQKSKVNHFYVFPRSKVFEPKKKLTSIFPSTLKVVKLQRSSSKKSNLPISNISLIKKNLLPTIKLPKLESQNSSTVLNQSHKIVRSNSKLFHNRLKNSPYYKPVNPSSRLNLFSKSLFEST